MGKISKEEKKGLGEKFREFKKSGLESYAGYLQEQKQISEGVAIRKAYLKYIEKEIKRTAKKIAKLEGKLS